MLFFPSNQIGVHNEGLVTPPPLLLQETKKATTRIFLTNEKTLAEFQNPSRYRVVTVLLYILQKSKREKKGKKAIMSHRPNCTHLDIHIAAVLTNSTKTKGLVTYWLFLVRNSHKTVKLNRFLMGTNNPIVQYEEVCHYPQKKECF